MVVGILTTLRNPPTVLDVAQRLVHVGNPSDYTFLVWQSYSASGDALTKSNLEQWGFSVTVQRLPYPEVQPDRIRITWNDSMERMQWRTNHVLDYANLLEKTLDYEADFVMILEDDMMPAWHALDKAYKSLTTELTIPHHQLGYVAFFSNAPRRAMGLNRITGNLGYEGGCTLTYSRPLVPKIISLLRGDPYAYPVDLAVGRLVDRELKLQSYERVPHLFQHNSKRSTYTARDQVNRKTEQSRSIYFMYDEDNYTQVFHPSQPNGYIGCYKDSEEFSDLSGLNKAVSEVDAMGACAKLCKKYLYFGLQMESAEGLLCYCGNEFGYYGSVQEGECPAGSGGDGGRFGLQGRNAVYRVTPFRATFIGCYKDRFDHLDHRDMEYYAGARFTPISCSETCSQYKYFGLQNGGECYCGGSYGRHGSSDIGTCLMRCSSNSKLLCGGSGVNAIFHYLTTSI